MFYLVQPYANGADRLRTATMVNAFSTLAEAFAELDRIGERLNGFGIAGDAIELIVVDEQRQAVRRPGAA